MAQKVLVYDTTLRDGMQGEGMSLSAGEKVRVAHALDSLGVHLIEAGFPASNPKEEELFELLARERFEHAEVAAFGMTRRRDAAAAEDPALRLLAESFAPVCTLVGKTWSLHLEKVTKVDPEENLRMIADSVAFLVGEGKRVVYDAEHFFDAYRDDAGLRAALPAGRRRGGRRERDALRHERLVAAERGGRGHRRAWWPSSDGVQVGIHTHDDAGCGVANALVAVEHGARMVQGTMNGYGERCGNANLVSILPALELKLGFEAVGRERLRALTETAHLVDELCNVTSEPEPALRGRQRLRAQGRHARGRRERATRAPSSTSTRPRWGRTAACSSPSSRARAPCRRGPSVDDDTAARVVERVKELESRGYQFEAADGSFDLLIRKETGEYEPLFRLEAWRAIVEKREDGTRADGGHDQDLGGRRALREDRRGQRPRARARQGAAPGDRRALPAHPRHPARELQGADPGRGEGHRRGHARAARRQRRARHLGLDRRVREHHRGELGGARGLARGGHAPVAGGRAAPARGRRERPRSRSPGPLVGEREERAVLETLRSGRLALGPRLPEFEEALGRSARRARTCRPSRAAPPGCTWPCAPPGSSPATRW